MNRGVWVVTASIDAAVIYPVAVLRGEDNPAFFLVEFREWYKELEQKAKEQTPSCPRKTCKARRQGYVKHKIIDAGLDPKWLIGDSTKVFVAWLLRFKGYKVVKHETVAIKLM